MFTSLVAAALAQACETTYSDLDMRGVAVLAEEAFASVDADGFSSAHSELMIALDCLAEPLQPTTVGKVFLVRGLAAHLDGNPPQVDASMAAFVDVEDLAPPSGVAPVGHPIRTAWEKAKLNNRSPRHALPVPDGGRIWIDGEETLNQPEERPYLIQMVTNGAVTWTKLVPAGGAPPEYAAAPEQARSAYSDHIIRTDRKHPVGLAVVAGVLAAGAIGTYAASAATNAQYKNIEKTNPSELPGLRTTNNALVITSIGLGAGALGTGVAAVITW